MTTGRDWWRGAALYQIYLRSFQDSDGDGIGDLPGVVDRLDYVASLGVDGIWLTPFFASPMRDFGYDVSDHCAVDRSYGSLDDFDRLLERAHALGLRVVIDQVWSHTSDAHPWFAESRASRSGPRSDWYVWADPKPDGSPPNNWQSWFGGPAWSSVISADEQARFAREERVPLLIDAAGQPLKRSFIHVTDLVEAMLAALDNPAAHQQLFNIAMNRPLDYGAVAAHLARTRGLESARIETPFHSNWLDNSKARHALNWEPNYDAIGLVDAAFAYQRAADDPRKVWYVG